MRSELYNGEILKDGIDCAIKKGGKNTLPSWIKLLDYLLTFILVSGWLFFLFTCLKYLISTIIYS